MTAMIRPIALTVFALAALGCQQSRSLPKTYFKALEGANRVEILTPPEEVTVITNKKRIAALAKFFEKFETDWKAQKEEPVFEVLIGFFKDDNHLAYYGAAPGVIAHGETLFWQKPLSDEDYKELIGILGSR